MNETVKAALLDMRQGALEEVRNSANGVALYRQRLADKEQWHALELARLADIELHLKDNGVDLATVDAEAEKARPVISLGGQHSVVGQQAGLYQDSLGGVNTNLSNQLRGSLNGFNQANHYDPTAALAKALDEA